MGACRSSSSLNRRSLTSRSATVRREAARSFSARSQATASSSLSRRPCSSIVAIRCSNRCTNLRTCSPHCMFARTSATAAVLTTSQACSASSSALLLASATFSNALVAGQALLTSTRSATEGPEWGPRTWPSAGSMSSAGSYRSTWLRSSASSCTMGSRDCSRVSRMRRVFLSSASRRNNTCFSSAADVVAAVDHSSAAHSSSAASGAGSPCGATDPLLLGREREGLRGWERDGRRDPVGIRKSNA
mmetsp:Transcript_64091/g.147611  ORF Transcript_64091/g.147611 Transcript_64091/m.147611 type:complete len:246 (+) Transcript_64091:360-1097(+)